MSINVPRTVRNLFLWTLVAGLCSGIAVVKNGSILWRMKSLANYHVWGLQETVQEMFYSSTAPRHLSTQLSLPAQASST